MSNIEFHKLPSEVIIEIFKYTIGDLKFIFILAQVCKNWNLILEDEEFGFCKYFYNSYFNWRNNNPQNSTSYKRLLQNEIQFWNNWSFEKCDLFSSINIKPNILQITRKNTCDKKNYINNKPLFYNSGIYYFEIKSLKDHGTSDNMFVGFLLKDKNVDYINHDDYLGCMKGSSFGLFFCNGDIYGFNNKNDFKKYADGHIPKNTTVGVYLDTNSLKVRFVVLVEDGKVFRMAKLDEFFTKKLLDRYCNGQLALYPAVSMLYENDIMELNTTAGFQSIEKVNWIKNVLSKE